MRRNQQQQRSRPPTRNRRRRSRSLAQPPTPTITSKPQQYDDPDDDDYYTRGGQRRDPRFDPFPDEVPWASVALALFLLAFGALSLTLAWLHWTQAIFGKEQAEIGFTIMGLLTVIPGVFGIHDGVLASSALARPAVAVAVAPLPLTRPLPKTNQHQQQTGAYHSWIALCVWLGVEGYRWSDIPSYS